MAEQEVIKHTKKVYRVWNNKQHTLWHKVKETLFEIFIIVFAITISIWFHNRSEHSHQQADVKDFLVGLKGDLSNDINEMKQDKAAYENQYKIFTYISQTKIKDTLNSDTLKRYKKYIFNATALSPNNGRFEGFKASGKIGTIENRELQNNIMDLYQENIPSLLMSTDAYKATKVKLLDYVMANRVRLTDSTTNLRSLLMTAPAYNISASLNGISVTPDNSNEIVTRYDSCISKMKTIISMINKEYDLK